MLVLVAALGACAGVEAPPPLPHAARPVVELERWQVFDGDRQVGVVRYLEIRDPSGAVRYYSIEDPQRRRLGSATSSGRFTRFVPFRDDGEDLGVWSLASGTTRLFEASADLELRPVAREADARRIGR